MKPIEIICQDLFDKIRSRFQNLEMGDESGSITLDPGLARFFDFDFIYEETDLGRVSISLNDIGSLKIFYSKGITENKDDLAKRLWFNFLKEMRMFAMRRLLRFDTRDITKNNLDKNDFQYLATQSKKEDEMNQMNESRWNGKNSRKTSRRVNNKTKVIVRHINPVDEARPGSRSQRNNIKAIFIESPIGERFMYPLKHLEGACAMAQHVEHGGRPHDVIGKKIISISEEISKLQQFNKQVQRSQLHDDAMRIAENANARLTELKILIDNLGKKRYYENWIAEYTETEDNTEIPELDPVTLEDYKNKFTQKNFQETFMDYFPLLHKIMKETSKINLEDYVNKDHQGMENYNHDDSVQESMVDEFEQFESWAEAVERNEIDKETLKKELENIQTQALADPTNQLDLNTAYDFFKQFINDDELKDKYDAAQEFPDMDPMKPFIDWANESGNTELLTYLGIEQAEQAPTEPQPAQMAPTEPQPAQAPVEQQQPVAESSHNSRSLLIKEVAKIVNQFYNREHVHQEDIGPFPKGETGICLEVQKRISEKMKDYYPEDVAETLGEEAAQLAKSFMERIVQKDQHSKEMQELQRIKELAKIHSPAEGIGDRGISSIDFNKNIMSPR